VYKWLKIVELQEKEEGGKMDKKVVNFVKWK
jgi:hypothetical protein